jgi:uncharacterized OsmC-like protein
MYTVNVSNKGAGVFNVKTRENEIAVALTGNEFSPAEVLLASLGSCIGIYIRRYAEQANLEIKEFDIRLESDWSQEKPMALRQISCRVDLRGAVADPKRREALLAFVGNCPIKATLAVNPVIDIKIV